ncbi:uncharacterized protein CMC5_030200 [Chondromyces crocatus]|uniref:Uncharacterized protein n=1 Tax=Chondromyces crocatus TaxID=52 RepID=A0A0K1EE62_CHOCO|nr:uncharacterized protein CMC5_030200 [Chondromyces crocatus]
MRKERLPFTPWDLDEGTDVVEEQGAAAVWA